MERGQGSDVFHLGKKNYRSIWLFKVCIMCHFDSKRIEKQKKSSTVCGS